MKWYQIYLMLDGKYSNSYTNIRADEIHKINETTIEVFINDSSVIVDFQNEILGIFPLQGNPS